VIFKKPSVLRNDASQNSKRKSQKRRRKKSVTVMSSLTQPQTKWQTARKIKE